MTKLKEHLLGNDGAKRDKFFIDIYNKAESLVKIAVAKEAKNKGHPVAYGANEIISQLSIFLAKELSLGDLKNWVKEMHEKAVNWEPTIEDDEQISKLAAAQQALINYTLDENECIENWKIEQLRGYCQDYKTHLEEEICNDTTPDFQTLLTADTESIRDDKLRIAVQKYHAIDSLSKKLYEQDADERDLPVEERLTNFRTAYVEKKELIGKNRNDSWTMAFLKGVATVFSFGIAAALGIWNSEGSKMNDNIEDVFSAKRKST